MKTNILKTVTISLGLLSAQALLAQTDNQISQQATYYELPTATANCDNSAESLNCHLMMNPAIEEGAKAAEEAVSARSSRNFFKEREAALKASGAAKTGIATPNQSASTVFSLKQPVFAVQVQVSKPISIVVQPSVASTASTEASFVATEEISKSTTPISQHFSAMAGTSSSSIEDSESTQEGAQEATTIEFLENEVCNNIYTKCLAKVVTMTLNQTGQAKNALGETAQAVAEWEDAKVLAAAELRIAKRALTKAKEESVAFKEAKDEAFNTPQTGYANAVYQLNKLKEQLVEAKVATACATRTAIEVRNNSNRTTCEERLEGAKKTEAHAFAIYHEAQGKFNKGDISFTQTSSHASNIGDKIFGPNIVIKPPQYGTMQDIRNSHTDQEIENFLLEKEALKETEKKFVAEREKINIEKAVLAEKAEALAKDRKDLEAERRTSASIASTQIKQTLDEKINALIDKQTALVQERAALDQKDLELKTLEKSLNKTQDDLGKREKELLAKEKAFEQESNAARQAIERDRNKLAQERNGISAKENTLKTSQEILAKEIVDLEIQRKALAQQQKALEESQKTASVKDKQTLDSQIAALVNQQKKLATQDVDLKKQVADLITQKTALDHIKTTLDQKEANLKFREKELVDAKDAIARATADLETRQKTLEKTWNKKETDALKAQQTAYQTLQAAEAAKKQAEKIAAQHAISAQDANAYAEQANLDKEAALKAQQEAESRLAALEARATKAESAAEKVLKEKQELEKKAAEERVRVAEEARKEAERKEIEFLKTENVKAFEAAKTLANEAGKVTASATAAYNRAMTANSETAWQEAIQQERIAETAWNQSVAAFQKGRDMASEKLKDPWMKELEIIENGKAHSGANMIWCQVQKEACMTTAVYNKAVTASQEEVESINSILGKIEQLWDEAIQKAQLLETSFAQSEAICRTGRDRVSDSLKIPWAIKLTKAYEQKTQWTATIKEWEKQKNQVMKEKRERAYDLFDTGWADRKHSVNPLIEYAKDSTYHQDDPLNCNRRINQPLTSHLPPPTTIRPVSQIVTADPWKEWPTTGKTTSISSQFQTDQIQIAQESECEKIQKAKAKAAKAAEVTELAQAAREKAQSTTGNSAQYQNSIADSLKEISLYWTKTAEHIIEGNKTFVTEYTEAIERLEKAIEQFTLALQADKAGKKVEGFCWYEAGKSTQSSATTMIQVSKILAVGNNSLSVKYAELSEKYHTAAEQIVKAAKAFTEGKDSEAWPLVSTAMFTKSVVSTMEYSLKANKVRTNEKDNLRIKYEAVAEKMDQAVEFYKKASKAYALGKTEEGQGWIAVGFGLYSAAENLGKAIEAEIADKPEIARKYREASGQHARSVKYYTQAAEAYVVGKTEEGQSWFNAGLGFANGADKLEKAIEAEIADKPEIARKYREAAEQQARSVNLFTQAAEAYVVGKTNEGCCWNNAGLGFDHGAEKLGKAIAAEIASKPETTKNCEAADKYQQAAAKYTLAAERDKQSAEKHRQAAEARSKGTFFTGAGKFEAEGNTLKAEGDRLDAEALALKNAADAIVKKTEGEGGGLISSIITSPAEQTANESLNNAMHLKTEAAWEDAIQKAQIAETACEVNQKSIWAHNIKLAQAKLVFAKAKTKWAPISLAMKAYIANPNATVSSREIASALDLRRDLKTIDGVLSNKVTVSGVVHVVGGATLGFVGGAAAIPWSIVWTANYGAFKEDGDPGVIAGSARALGGAITGALASPFVGAYLGAGGKFENTTNTDITTQTTNIAQTANVAIDALKYFKDSPSSVAANTAADNANEAVEHAHKAIGTLMEDEANWTVKIAEEIAGFARIQSIRKK